MVSIDGRGRCKDNIWIERLWRTIKQEYVYIYPTDSVAELREGIGRFVVSFYDKMPHQSLGEAVTPSKMHVKSLAV